MFKHAATLAVGALLLAGCESSDHTRADSSRSTTTSSSTALSTSAEARILSTLHAANQEEIAMGQLARERGVSNETRRYGDMLVTHHTDADSKVKQTADAAGVTISSPAAVKEWEARDNPSIKHTNDMAEMRNLSGDSFDREFAAKMAAGHRKVIQKVEEARLQVQNARVKQLLDELLPTLRQHEQTALSLQSR
jgi:putative membrane protein